MWDLNQVSTNSSDSLDQTPEEEEEEGKDWKWR